MFTTETKTQYFKGLLYGRPGTGKTYSARTIPNLDATLIISAESGLLTLRDIKVEVWPVELWEDRTKTADKPNGTGRPTIHEVIQTLMNPAYHDRRAEMKQPPLETIFIDSATELAKKCMEDVLVERGIVMEARNKVMNNIFEGQMTLEEWGVTKPRIDRMFRTFRDMPYNIIFTALEHSMQSEETHLAKTMPLMYPQSLSETIPGYFDEVFHTRQGENAEKQIVRWWECVDDGTVIAKDRLGVFERNIQPNWAQVFNAIKGAR